MSFLTNLILFSPLLFMGLIIIMVLDRAESLRRGAGLKETERERRETERGRVGVGMEEDEEDDSESESADSEDEGEDGDRVGFGIGGVRNRNRRRERRNGARGEDEGFVEGREGGVVGDGYGYDGTDIGAGTEAGTGAGMTDEDGNYEDAEEQEEEGEEDDPLLGAGPSNTTHQLPPHPAAAAAAAAAAGQTPRPTPRTRNIGPKKAASLARKDQRRAYHEFQRTRALAAAEESRLADESRLDEVFAERQRRAVAEEEISLRREKERQAKLEIQKQEENKTKLDLLKLVRMISRSVERGRKAWRVSELCEGVGRSEEWVLRGLEKEGLVGVVESRSRKKNGSTNANTSVGGESTTESEKREWEMRMVTGKGYYIIVSQNEISRLFERLDNSGSKGMSWSEMGRVLEEIMGLQ